MESFIPFGGFFPVAQNLVAPSSRQHQAEDPCHRCSDKYDQELAALLKEFSVPVEEKCHMDFPELQQIDPISICGLPDAEAKDDGTVLNAKVVNLKKKWKDICQHLHQGSQILETDIFQVGSEAFPRAIGLPCVSGKESSNNETNRNIDGSLEENFQGNVFPLSVSLQKMSSVNKSISMPVISETMCEDLSSKLLSRPSRSEQLQTNGFRSHSGGLSDPGATDEHTSSSSVISVSTDLILGTIHPFINEESSKVHPQTVEYSPSLAYFKSQTPSMCQPVQTAAGPKVTGPSASAADKKNSCLSNIFEPCDIWDLKTFCSSLAGKVGWQEEAIHAISKTVAHCRTENEKLRGISLRGDIWLSFLGPDRVGKRKIAVALTELLFGSKDKLISVDLSFLDAAMPSNTLCNYQGTRYNLNLRGKTIVDHIAKELSEKPCSLVLLENIDKADLLLQSSLSQAIRTGKFSDSYRKEVGISNAVFVVTAGVKEETVLSNKSSSKFSEEQILAAKAWQMMILVDHASDSVGRIPRLDASGTSMREFVFVSKRKVNVADDRKGRLESMRTAKRAKETSSTFFDLNLPIEEMAADDTAYGSGESSSVSETVDTWMEEFLDTVDENVFFKPFDFDTFTDNILKEIAESFRNSVSSNCVLEIDPRAMEQILAATWLSEGKAALDNWLQQVLARSFVKARQHHNLSSQSVLRLVACEDVLMDDHAPGILLPSQILLG